MTNSIAHTMYSHLYKYDRIGDFVMRKKTDAAQRDTSFIIIRGVAAAPQWGYLCAASLLAVLLEGVGVVILLL